MNKKAEIASISRYQNLWQHAKAREQEEVINAINTAIEKYGPDINCAMLHRYLKKRFPFAVCWGSVDHILTEIGGCLYDKSGLVAERVAPEGVPPHWFKSSFKWPKTNEWKYE